MVISNAIGLTSIPKMGCLRFESQSTSCASISERCALVGKGKSEARICLSQSGGRLRRNTMLEPSAYNVMPSVATARLIRPRKASCVAGVTSGATDFAAYDDGTDNMNALSTPERHSKFTRFVTSERVKVVLMMALAMALCNADRTVMSVAIAPLQEAYGWSGSFAGVVQSSFLWGYLLSPIAGGTLADNYGGKIVMAWGLAIWSLTTFLTPWAARHSVGMLLAVRALFGVAQGAAFPCMNTLLASWFPCTERATAVGLSMVGFHLGNVISLLVSPLVMTHGHTSKPFYMFGLLGFIWLSIWLPLVYNEPHCHPGISKSELLHIQDQAKKVNAHSTSALPPLRSLFSKLPTWAVTVASFTHNWGYFVLLSWMPVYFKTVFDINLKQAAWFSAVPWMMMAFTSYVAGAFADFLIQQGCTITFVRKFMQSIGFIGPGLALLALNYAPDPTIASTWLTLALGLGACSQAGYLLNIQDIAPQYTGFLNGVTNCVGTVAAIIGTTVTGYFVYRCGSFRLFLQLTSALYFLTAIFWNLACSGERVF